MDGLLPAKFVSIDPSELPPTHDPSIVTIVQKAGTEPADPVCEGCEVSAFEIVNHDSVDGVRVVSDGGLRVCNIYLNGDQVVIDECGWHRP